MNGYDSRIDVLGGLADYFDQSGFKGSYAVLNGISPDGRLGRDVDFLCAPSVAERLSQLSMEFFEAKRVPALKYESPWGIIVIGREASGLVPAIEIDFNYEFFWGFTSLVKGAPEMKSNKVCGIPCAAWEGFAKRVLLQFLSGNIGRLKSAEKAHELAIFPSERAAVHHHLTEIFGARKAIELTSAIEARNWRWFSQNRWRYCGLFSWWGLISSPLGVLRSVGLRWRVRRWRREAPQVVPEVICVAKDIDSAREYSRNLKAVLTHDYVFSPVAVEPFLGSLDLRKKKKTWDKRQRLLGLLILYSDRVPDRIDAACTIVVKPETHSPEEASNAVIARHFELVMGRQRVR